MEIVLASSNKNKAKEFEDILKPLDIKIILQSDLNITSPVEDGLSFVENALIKARHASKIAKRPAFADDSGLCVDYLQGAPGIYSARFAGENATDEENNDKLLSLLKDVKMQDRKAQYYCALVYVRHENDPLPIIALSSFNGVIAKERMGNNGFGYDPLFFIPNRNSTVAQLPPQIKNLMSHRAKAMAKMLRLLKKEYGK